MNDPQKAEATASHAPSSGGGPPPPRAQVKKRTIFSPIWLIPIVVGFVVAYVAYDTIMKRGDSITLTFQSGDGLVPGETPIKHKNVRLGVVQDVRLSDDLSHVDVRVKVERHSKKILTDHARFWVVRPRFSAGLAGLASGLETIVSGAYIEVDPGAPGGAVKESFTGLEEPPGVRSDEPGRVFVVKAEKLGSLSSGSPIYYREVNAGEVLKYELGAPHTPITLSIFVRAPFDKLVDDKTHFWNVSGLAVNMGPSGLKVELTSLQAAISGGISFGNPKGVVGAPVPDNREYLLYDDKDASDAALFQNRIPCVTYFSTSVAGVSPGTMVQLLGTPVGQVDDVTLVHDPKKPGAWLARVAFEVQPERLSLLPDTHPLSPEALREHPARVFLDSQSIITGTKVLSLDFAFVKPMQPGEVTMEGDAIVLPGEGGGIDNLTVALGRVAAKLEQIPFDDIGKNLDLTLKSVQTTIGGEDMQNAVHQLSLTMNDVHKLVKDADNGLTPALARLPAIADQLQQAVANANQAFSGSGYGANSDFQRNATRLMQQVSEAMRSLRLLADFLDRHPEALLRGRSDGAGK